MAKADSVLSTPPTNTPVDTTRRRFLTVAAVGSIVGAGSLAAAAVAPNDVRTAVTMPSGSADPALAFIAEKRAADIAHGEAIDAQDRADAEFGYDSDFAALADEDCCAACWAVNEIDWRIARTPPTTLGGIAAVLRFANEIEDGGTEWPDTDTIGAEGWHYQLRAAMAQAIETLLKAQAGKAVQS